MNNIRNFCIIAHIDHGKSTLADRFLELTGTVEKRKMKEQLLDQMELERERGITIKLQPVTMHYEHKIQNSLNLKYTLNLIDTPGHVDFGYEVSRSLAAVEGAVLLVDSTKGVQAQTLANLYQAIEANLAIIPVVNKIDLPNANIEQTKKEIVSILGCTEEEILEVSGKTGQGVEELLEEIVDKIPAPVGEKENPLKALIFDSQYNTYKGVVAYVRIFDGEVERGDNLYFFNNAVESEAIEVGHLKPDFCASQKLSSGNIGYIATGLKDVSKCRVGDTITLENKKNQVEQLPGYKNVSPMVYASFYPKEGDDYQPMREALERLTLNDAAFIFEPEANPALGKGFRCGFLGLLHLEIIQARLEQEFELSPVITTPSVVYEAQIKGRAERKKIYSPSELPETETIEAIFEPWVNLEIISPAKYLGVIMELLGKTRSRYENTDYIDNERVVIKFKSPLVEVITNLHDDLKSATSGYASMNYQFWQYEAYNLVKLDILVGGEKVEALSRIVPKEDAFSDGKKIVEKLKDSIPRQNFQINLQAALGGKIIARETIRPFRKDVTAKLYGGDVTRKRKLLEKQKKGKKKMQASGKVDIPSEAFLSVFKK